MKKRKSETTLGGAESGFVAVEVHDDRAGNGIVQRLEVARFPTTVAEYREFIEAHGYQTEKWWSQSGWAWRRRHKITCPRYWDKPGYDVPTLPVTGVSFWEAEAYARFRDAALPTEREWYLLSSKGGISRFPWGDDGSEPSQEHANLGFFREFTDDDRVPVDRTVRSSSPEGVRDLIGNVGEWCLPGSSPELAVGEMTGVLRGGACWHPPGVADASFRDLVPLTVRDNQTGIRLIRRTSSLQPVGDDGPIGWPRPPRPLGRRIERPTKPFRQEEIPMDLTEESWRLRIHGEAIQPREFSLAELRRNFRVNTDTGLSVCVCRWGEVNTFTGVLLRDVLEACGANSMHLLDLYLRQVSTRGPKGWYETTVPIKEAFAHKALLAWAMDGRDLTPELGWPLRFVDLHRYGYKQVKSLAELVVTDECSRGWWERRCNYDIDGTILPGSITIVGEEAMRLDIEKRGRVTVPWPVSARPRSSK